VPIIFNVTAFDIPKAIGVTWCLPTS